MEASTKALDRLVGLILGAHVCRVKLVTGGGSIDSVLDSGGTANFGFNADSCSGTPRGHFNYIDKNADPTTWPGGVKMNGDVIDAVQCGAFDIDLVESCFNDPVNCPDPGIQQAITCFNNQDVTCLLETPSVFCALCLVEVFEALGGLDCLSSVPACGAYVVKVDYRSTNPQVPGTGTAFACVLDRGEGANGTTDGAGDVGLVAALDGPYAPNGLFGAG